MGTYNICLFWNIIFKTLKIKKMMKLYKYENIWKNRLR